MGATETMTNAAASSERNAELIFRPTCYIAGPIAFRENGNKEAFEDAYDALKNLGFAPVNPHRLEPRPHDINQAYYTSSCPPGFSRADPAAEHNAACHMRMDIGALATCSHIYLLDGWEESQGARIEYFLARYVFGCVVVNPPAPGRVIYPPAAMMEMMAAWMDLELDEAVGKAVADERSKYESDAQAKSNPGYDLEVDDRAILKPKIRRPSSQFHAEGRPDKGL